MSRVARIVAPRLPHHVTQRGNRQANIFLSDEDRYACLRYLHQYSQKHGFRVWAYCLMTNHVHIVGVPSTEESLSRTFRDAHTVYAMRFNKVNGTSGHLWQGRFNSCPLDENHLWAAVRYVERNPVRAGLVRHACEYAWSSAQAHSRVRADKLLDPGFPPENVIEDWADWLMDEDDPALVHMVRHRTEKGTPCGNAAFVRTVQERMLRRD